MDVTSITVGSSTQITVVAPAHATGTVDVLVTTPSGTSANTAADDYNYVSVPISPCSIATQIPSLECDALSELYNGTGGSSWTNNSGWLNTDTPCSWHGVSCIAGHVVNLTLTNNLLKGTIPVELGNLSHITRIDLDSNQLSGSIPTELGNLPNLTHLKLDVNQFSGSLPQNLTN